MTAPRSGTLLLWWIAVLVVAAGPPAYGALGAALPRGTPPPPPGTGMTVTGILGGSVRVAIIRTEGQTVIAGVGEHVGNAVVVSILSKKVVLKEGSVTFELPGPSTGAGVPLVLAVGPPGGTPPPPPGAGMMVTGILGGSARVAIIRTEGRTVIAGVGEHVGDAVVISILSNKVVLKKRGVTFELPMGDTH
jgi:hypothetical protein